MGDEAAERDRAEEAAERDRAEEAVGRDRTEGAAEPDRADEGVESDDADEGTYGGLLGAIGYAFRQSDSRLLRSYVLLGTLVTALVTALFVQSVIVLLGDTVGATGGTFTFSRAFVVVIGLLVVGPLLAPIISTARRHRHGTASPSTDASVAALGYLNVVALYVALVISAPPELRDPATGILAPVVEQLYAAPPTAALVPVVAIAVGTVAIWHLHRRNR